LELKIDLAESEGQLLIIFYLTSKEEKERRTLCAINIIFINFIPIIQSVFIFIFKYFYQTFSTGDSFGCDSDVSGVVADLWRPHFGRLRLFLRPLKSGRKNNRSKQSCSRNQ